jgi:thymidylate kinase
MITQDTAAIIGSAHGHSLPHFLRLLFRLLDENAIQYCVLHSWQGLPDALASDLDLAVHPRDHSRLAFVFRSLFDEGYRPVQHRHYAAGGHRFDFAWVEPEGVRFAGIDVTDECRQGGLILIRAEELVRNRAQFRGFWVAHPAVEFSYLLAKTIGKGILSQVHAARLKALVNELGKPQAQQKAGELVGAKWQERVVDGCTSGTLGALFGPLKKQIWLTKLRRDPLNPLRHALSDVPRLVSRVFRPSGLFLVILGVDGVGKSTLAGRLAEPLEQAAYRGFRIYHWRPMVIVPQNGTGGPATDPHHSPPRGSLGSIVALFGVFLDCWFGFALVIRPLLVRSGLVIFDRFYHDLLIDPLRYRYGGPMWLARLLGRFVPPFDPLFLVLDAGDDVILSRKRELPAEELRRLQSGYREFARGAKRATLVNADRGIGATVEEANRLVVGFLSQRFQQRNTRWLAPSRRRISHD